MAVSYGLFINSLISFLIVAFAVFMIVRSFNRLKRQAEKEEVAAAPEEVPEPSVEVQLLSEIRDLLRTGGT